MNDSRQQNKQGSAAQQAELVLVHGLYFAPEVEKARDSDNALIASRQQAFEEHGEALGVCAYEWLDGRGKPLANRMLQWLRGTARAVEAVEIITLHEAGLRASIASESGRALWRQVASCEPYGLDTRRSFTLIGKPRQLLDGPAGSQRVIWFGNGLGQLSRAEFIRHYTTRHGPLVAGHAQLIGLKRYRQVPAEHNGLYASLCELGLGQGPAPAVFAELEMGAPPLKLSGLRARRAASWEIKADEKRHIDFSKSMLLLPTRQFPQ